MHVCKESSLSTYSLTDMLKLFESKSLPRRSQHKELKRVHSVVTKPLVRVLVTYIIISCHSETELHGDTVRKVFISHSRR